MRKIIITVILVAAMTTTVWADTTLPSWWDQANLRRKFTFVDSDGAFTRTPTEDTNSPYGYGFSAHMTKTYIQGPPPYFEYKLSAENWYIPNNIKHVWLRYTWRDQGETNPIGRPWGDQLRGATHGNAPDTVNFAWHFDENKSEQRKELGNDLFQSTAYWTITPQPGGEWFKWLIPTSVYLKEVEITTYCIPIPAPGAVLLGAIGLSITGGLRRRRVL